MLNIYSGNCPHFDLLEFGPDIISLCSIIWTLPCGLDRQYCYKNLPTYDLLLSAYYREDRIIMKHVIIVITAQILKLNTVVLLKSRKF